MATEEDAIEKDKLNFTEKEKALQQMQHAFNVLHKAGRNKENEKSLAVQRLQHLKERENNLQDFLQKAAGQLKGINESIEFTHQQIKDEGIKLLELKDKLESLKNTVEEKRIVFDEKRLTVDELRLTHQALQRHQFEVEKKAAVADASINNLQRTIHHLEEETVQRKNQLEQLQIEKQLKAKELDLKKRDLEQLQKHNEFTKEQILQTQATLEDLRSELAIESRKLDSRQDEYDRLQSLIDTMEGYPESVKFLHNNNGWNYTAPILSDIIYVNEEYRAA